jgi:hypothetical protein
LLCAIESSNTLSSNRSLTCLLFLTSIWCMSPNHRNHSLFLHFSSYVICNSSQVMPNLPLK